MIDFKQFSFKKFGYMQFRHNLTEQLLQQDLKGFIKIVFIKAGGHAIIDFKEYFLTEDAFIFIIADQYYWFDDNCSGVLMYYNRDFYCVEIHDKEVACDGILFNNVYEVPIVWMDAATSVIHQNILGEIKKEMDLSDTGTEEMLRILLKQIIIKCTRIWKLSHHLNDPETRPELEFSRKFSVLVEKNYTTLHTVSEYADLLHITPKALNKKLTKFSTSTPNDIIKNRIILEVKRLLVHTTLSIKEIGYKLGYEDASYFIRFFTKQAAISPQSFRIQYRPQ